MVQVRKPKRPASPKQAASCGGPIDDLLNPELFKALCDPTRARLLACLIKCGRACSVGEVAACCSVDLSVVSRHLAMLAKAGVLGVERRGREVWYGVKFAELCGSLRALADAVEEHRPRAGERIGGDCCGGGGCCG